MTRFTTQVGRADILRLLAVTRKVPWNAAELLGYRPQPERQQAPIKKIRRSDITSHAQAGSAHAPIVDNPVDVKEISCELPSEAFWYLSERRSLKKTLHRLTEQSEIAWSEEKKEKKSILPGVLLQIKPLRPEELSVPQFFAGFAGEPLPSSDHKADHDSAAPSVFSSPRTSQKIKHKKGIKHSLPQTDMEALVASCATFIAFQPKTGKKKQQDALKKKAEEKAARRFHRRLYRLLGLMSVAEFVEPALLQEIVRLLPSSTPDIVTEAALQAHPDVERADNGFIRIMPEKKKTYQTAFSREKSSLQADLLGLLRQRDAIKTPFLFALELLPALPLLHSDSMQKQIIIRLETYMLRLVRTWFDMQENSDLVALATRLLELIESLPEELRKRLTAHSFLYGIVHRHFLRNGAVIPPGYEPERVLRVVQNAVPPQHYQVLQQGEQLLLYPSHETVSTDFPGSPLVELELSRDVLLVHQAGRTITLPVRSGEPVHDCTGPEDALILQTASEQLFFGICFRPFWAETIGRNKQGLFVDAPWRGKTHRLTWKNRTSDGAGSWHGREELQADQYGLFVDLFLADQVVQRFRRILPGWFMMGSPEDEPERESWGKESFHKVILTKGFWVADTVVTQRLWEELIKTNSSYFRGAERPAEQVSYYDARLFLQRFNERIPGINARLLTEAEWEYCCRAGSTTPFSFGPRISPEQANYNGQYPYHTGVPGKNRKQTVPVRSLPCNAWGLYEMHGNVWEWCQDYWEEDLSAEEPQHDPQGPEKGEFRVVRGGSWSLAGRGVRSAVRGKFSPHFRNSCIGFRIALGSEQEPA